MNNQANKQASKNTLLTKIIFAILLALIILTLVLKTQQTNTQQTVIDKNTYIEFPDRKPLPIVTLAQADTDGFSTSKIKGKWHILYFGYTFCPDICPLELTVLQQMMEILRKDIATSDLPQILFISIDPERDKPEQVKKYVAAFDSSFMGLTGKQDALTALASPFGIAWMKDAVPSTQESKDNNFYTVSHSTTLLLVNPDSKVAGMFPAPHSAKAMAQAYKNSIKKEKVY